MKKTTAEFKQGEKSSEGVGKEKGKENVKRRLAFERRVAQELKKIKKVHSAFTSGKLDIQYWT